MPLGNFPHTFVQKTKAKASEVNANFQHIKDWINVTKIATDDIQDGAVTESKLAAALKSILGLSGTGKVVPVLPAARAYHNVNQAIIQSVWTPLALNSERYDNDAIHDPAANNSRLTCKTAGLYAIDGCASVIIQAVEGTVGIGIRLNGNTFLAIDEFISSGTGGNASPVVMEISTQYKLAVNDYVELCVFHTTAGESVLATGNYSPEFAMVCVGTG